MVERTFLDYKRYDYSRVGRFKMNQRLGFDTPNDSEHRTLQMQDLIAIISEIIRLNNTFKSQLMISTHSLTVELN